MMSSHLPVFRVVPVTEGLTRKLLYSGPPAYIGLVAQLLCDEGVEVAYAPPVETRDAMGALAVVTVVLAATGPTHVH
jgi:hypothetical protein